MNESLCNPFFLYIKGLGPIHLTETFIQSKVCKELITLGAKNRKLWASKSHRFLVLTLYEKNEKKIEKCIKRKNEEHIIK